MNERLPGESLKAYAAFIHYRDMDNRNFVGAYRSYLIKNNEPVVDKNGKPKQADSSWKAWRKRFNWEERISEYDRCKEEAISEVSIIGDISKEITLKDYLSNIISLRHEIQKSASSSTVLVSTVQEKFGEIFFQLDADITNRKTIDASQKQVAALNDIINGLKKISEINDKNITNQMKVMEIDKMILFLKESKHYESFEQRLIREEEDTLSVKV